jgi:hypothetical protein
MLRKKALLLTAMALLVLPACQSSAVSTQEILNGVLAAMEDVRSYRFDAGMAIEVSGDEGEGPFTATIEMAFTGAADIAGGRMQADIDMTAEVPDEGEMSVGMSVYLLEDVMYAGIDMSAFGFGVNWMKAEPPEVAWEQLDQLGPQIEFLETSEVKLVGSDIVNGVDCHVLEVTADPAKIWALAMRQSQLPSEGLPDFDADVLQDILRSFSMKQWVAKDTFFLVKAEMKMDMDVSGEALGDDSAGDARMLFEMDLLMSDYNQPVSIELPPEAEDATEVQSSEIFS